MKEKKRREIENKILMYDALFAKGVDNWDGYDEAIGLFFELRKKADELKSNLVGEGNAK